MTLLHQARHDLRMKTVGPLSVQIPDGKPFDYFDEIRKITQMASSDLLFVDPYLDAEFVSRYLPQITSRSDGPATYVEEALSPATGS